MNMIKKYREENKEQIAERRSVHKERDRKRVNEWAKSKRKIDPMFKIRGIFSNMIGRGLKNEDSSKNGKSWTDFVPYTPFELKQHLENQFESWMSWENHGKYHLDTWDDDDQSTWTWQIDHIVPHSDFHYTSMEDEEFKICWSLENLRPLSAKINLIEGTRKVRRKK